MDERELITYPTWLRYMVVASVVSDLSVCVRRRVFHVLRQEGRHVDIFFPSLGLTLGEFCVWYTLRHNRRKKRPKGRKDVLTEESPPPP